MWNELPLDLDDFVSQGKDKDERINVQTFYGDIITNIVQVIGKQVDDYDSPPPHTARLDIGV